MKQEDKELLLKDLCARLPYEVRCEVYDPQQDYGEDIFDAHLIHIDAWTSRCYFWGCSETDPYKIEQVKPYLRPMSNMTEKEAKELSILYGLKNILSTKITDEYIEVVYEDGFWHRTAMICYDEIISSIEIFDWLNKHHFDYRHLIEKHLAIEVTKKNNPYSVKIV